MRTFLCPFCMSEVQNEICPNCGNPVSYTGDPTHLPVGHVLEDKRSYVLGAALGQGGFGVTYIAWDNNRKQRVAIKEYFPTYCSSRTGATEVSAYRGQEETYLKGRARFLDEARMLKSLSDLKSMVNVLDFFEANNSAYLVMEYLDGLSLKDYVQKNGKLPAQQFLNQLKPLMADMEKMHRRGVVHRDIAPDNIILLPDGRLKLIDFGAARSYVGDKSMTVVVKKGFAPVEQYMRKGSNASTDVYALAATIYYCITGIVPPDSAERQYGEALLQAPSMLGADILPHQERALEQALEIQPKDRLQSIAEFLKALFNAPRAVPVQPAPAESGTPVSAAEQKKTLAPQLKTKNPKTTEQRTKEKNAPLLFGIVAVLAVCIGAGILFAGVDWPEKTVQLEAEQTETVETQPEESLSPEEMAYNEAVDFFKNGEYGKAAIAFAKLGDFRDSRQLSKQIWDAIAVRDTIGAGYEHTVALKNDGTVIACGSNSSGECDVSDWTDIVAVSAGTNYTLGLKADGTVVATGKSGIRQINVDDWKDIVAIDAGQVIAYGLRSDGTVLTTGNDDFQKEVSTLMNISSIDALDHWNYFCAVEPDGTLVELDGLDQVKYFSAINVDGMVYDNFEISQWQDLRELADGFHGMAKLKTDGTVGFEFYRDLDISRKFDTEDWRDITSISMGTTHLLGLKADGTVLATGDNGSKQCAVGEWTDIVSVKAGQEYSVGLKSDGTLVTSGSSRNGKRLTSEWTDIRLPADRDALLGKIQIAPISGGEPQTPADGDDETEADKLAYNEAIRLLEAGEYGKAAIAFGKLKGFRDAGEISLKIWNAIADREVIGSGYGHVAALKADGTVVAAGTAENGRCEVDSWTQIVGISVGTFNTVAVRADGTVFAVGDNQRDECDVGNWTDIAAVYSTGFCTFGLKSDGTVIYAGDAAGSEEVTQWEDIVSISISNYLVGLKSDGTVVHEENPYFDLRDWKDIVQISAAGYGHVIGLRSDGTVITAGVHGADAKCNCDVAQWTDITAVSAGSSHLLGLKKDGTVVAAGSNSSKQCDVQDWKNIVKIQTGYSYSSFGITSDGKVLTAGTVKMGDTVRSDWKNIRQPVDRNALLAQIHPGQASVAKPVSTQLQMPESYYRENVLMEVKDPDNLNRDSMIFNTSVKRKDVASITFLDTLHGAPKKAADASRDKNGTVKAWATENGGLYDIYVAAEGGVCPPADCRKLFAELPCMTSIQFGDAFVTDHVTSMSGMFFGCKSLAELDVSGFDTSGVTDMSYLFYGCEKLTELKLNLWDTSRVSDMEYMFAMCESMEHLALTGFNTGSVTNMCSMFANCKNLANLDLRSFDTSRVSDMGAMFSRCSELTEVNLSSFDTSRVTDMGGMFLRCEKLSILDLHTFDTSGVTNMKSMFMNCYKLENLDVNHFDVSRVEDMQDMFTKCPAAVPEWYQE